MTIYGALALAHTHPAGHAAGDPVPRPIKAWLAATAAYADDQGGRRGCHGRWFLVALGFAPWRRPREATRKGEWRLLLLCTSLIIIIKMIVLITIMHRPEG